MNILKKWFGLVRRLSNLPNKELLELYREESNIAKPSPSLFGGHLAMFGMGNNPLYLVRGIRDMQRNRIEYETIEKIHEKLHKEQFPDKQLCRSKPILKCSEEDCDMFMCMLDFMSLPHYCTSVKDAAHGEIGMLLLSRGRMIVIVEDKTAKSYIHKQIEEELAPLRENLRKLAEQNGVSAQEI